MGSALVRRRVAVTRVDSAETTMGYHRASPKAPLRSEVLVDLLPEVDLSVDGREDRRPKRQGP
ncbi:hypothetical protein, partial [Streptomyces sp. BF23-19]|uniref:hypothetical protein n=1 Tax=Streptomyces sp. BF23-19 TaxID=3240283 RepID=UPI0034E3B956